MDELEKQKLVLHKIREFVNNISKSSNNISRLMIDKVEDYILLEEQPLPIKIGDRVIFIGTFTFSTEQVFWKEWVKILACLHTDKLNFDLLNSGVDLYKALKLHKALFKLLCKMLHKTIIKQQGYFYRNDNQVKMKWNNCTLKWLIDNITTEKLIQICMLIYVYNFDAEKKNIKIILEATGSKDLGEMYIYSWLQNLTGLTGKFAESQALSIESVFADKMSSTPNLSGSQNEEKSNV